LKLQKITKEEIKIIANKFIMQIDISEDLLVAVTDKSPTKGKQNPKCKMIIYIKFL